MLLTSQLHFSKGWHLCQRQTLLLSACFFLVSPELGPQASFPNGSGGREKGGGENSKRKTTYGCNNSGGRWNDNVKPGNNLGTARYNNLGDFFFFFNLQLKILNINWNNELYSMKNLTDNIIPCLLRFSKICLDFVNLDNWIYVEHWVSQEILDYLQEY